jgi:crotonobetainyl-CoA:carnitine CoA-transferase CaiB-like acyl-CoA transferase
VNLFETVVHPSQGPYRSIRSPVSFGSAPFRLRRHAPRLGEHTNEVLGELGLCGYLEEKVEGKGGAE